jgi:hypothetical protein
MATGSMAGKRGLISRLATYLPGDLASGVADKIL